MKTIGVDLWAGQVRAAAANVGTLYVSTAPLRRSPRELFVGVYARFAHPCRTVDEPGVALIAVDARTGEAAGIATVRARIDRHVVAIVGRHDRCDLFLPRGELALRQFAVVVDPVQSFARGAVAPYRVFDLRTAGGLVDESGRELRGLRAEGPAIVRCGGYVMFALPLGDPTDWPEDAEAAWACLPERVYCDELEHAPEGSLVEVPDGPRSGAQQRGVSIVRDAGTSIVSRTHGPWDSSVDLPIRGTGVEGRRHEPSATGVGEIAGSLMIKGPHGRGRLDIPRRALTDGVLLGRYARCDGAGLGGDESISRVHALMLLVDDRLLLVDTASRNGCRIRGDERTRVTPVTDGVELQLGCKTHARWRWTS